MDKKPYIVGICGGSASGKTFLLNQLLKQLPLGQVTIISQDNYYKKQEDQVKDEEGLINFDHPDSINMDELYQDIYLLIQNKGFSRWEYTFNNPEAVPRLLRFEPAPIIIVEGLFIYYRSEISRLIDLKLFIDTEEHIRLSRRLKRDHTERGYSVESILRDYEKYVAPMFYRYVAPLKSQCDMIIPNNRHMYKALQVLVNHLAKILEKKP
ncbi:MAG: uridine kinase [Bacteroidia bacterium]|nr:uridine kinase [Bacteroidia bacterium]